MKVEDAISFAALAHRGQRDRNGEPYIYHPLRVMLACRHLGDEVAAAAVLHDVIEDTDMQLSDLEGRFPVEVTLMVNALTRSCHETYADYIGRIHNSTSQVRAIKVADLEDNYLLLDRAGGITPALYRRYDKALHTLRLA